MHGFKVIDGIKMLQANLADERTNGQAESELYQRADITIKCPNKKREDSI